MIGGLAYYYGGIVGFDCSEGDDTPSRIENCINYGYIYADNGILYDGQYVGGIIGATYSTIISSCANFGSIEGKEYVGGIIGETIANFTYAPTIANCYSHGKVKARSDYAGGIIGYTEKVADMKREDTNKLIEVKRCVSDAEIWADDEQTGSWAIGDADAQVEFEYCRYVYGSDSYAGDAYGSGNDKITADQIADGYATYFLNNNTSDDTVVWRQNIDAEGKTADTTPVLCVTDENMAAHDVVYCTLDCWHTDYFYSNAPSTGGHAYDGDGNICTLCGYDKTGTKTITTIAELCQFARNVNKGLTENAKLAADLNLSGDSDWQTYGPIGTEASPFDRGTFNGQGHTIKLSYGNAADPQCLFGYVKNGGIKNLSITGSVRAQEANAASFIGHAYGAFLENCYSNLHINSEVEGEGTHGGLVSVNESQRLIILNCQFDGWIDLNRSTTNCGGFVGYNKPGCSVTMQNCLMSGEIQNKNTGDNLTSVFVRNKNANAEEGTLDITNSYYITDGGAVAQGTQTTEAQLTSGELTYLLNQSQSDEVEWVQVIGTDTKPQVVMDDDDITDGNIVYQIRSCSSDTGITYSNTNANDSIHQYTDGICKCGYVNGEEVTEEREAAAEWGTLCLPVQICKSDCNGISFYVPAETSFWDWSNSYLKIVEYTADIIPAGTPIIYYKKGGGNISIKGYGTGYLDDDASLYAAQPVDYTIDDNKWIFRGSYTATTIQNNMEEKGYTYFYLSGGQLWYASQKTSMAAHRAWIVSTEGKTSSARGISLVIDDETTGIVTTDTDATAGTRKQLRDGRIVIVNPRGETFTTAGSRIK